MAQNESGQPAEDFSTKKVFTTGEAAQVCKVSQQTIIRCFDSGRLQGFRVPGSKFRRIPRDELIRFMKANQIPLDAIAGAGGDQKRVLIVDDDERILQLMEDVLGSDDRLDVRVASTGYDAGMLTESFKPDLIVLDYLLPDINGTAVCRRVRQTERGGEIRVLCVSGVVNATEIDELMAAGADAFLKKPFDVDEMLGEVERLLGLEARGAAAKT